MPPSPIQMPTGVHASPIFPGEQTAAAGSQATSLPQSPGRSSFLPSFMRRPRAATGESLHGAPALPFDAPQPLSSESLAASNGPASPQPASRRRFTNSSQSGLPSPPLSSSHRDDPLVNFGQRLMRRISNQGGSAGSSASAVAGTGSSSANAASSPVRQGGPTRSMSTPPVTHGRTVLGAGSTHVYDEREERRASVTPANGDAAADAPASAVAASSSAVPAEVSAANAEASSSTAAPAAPVHRLRLVPLLEASNSLPFDPVVRDVPESTDIVAPAHTLRIGRFTDKQSGVDGVPRGGALTSNKVAFKSKVVSRIHAELWVLPGGRFFVRDSKSSSGTFLNHQRLSPPGQESKPFSIKDGDILQLGVDYQGGTEEIYKCVKMRAEIGRGWQTGANNFNTAALKQLQALGGGPGSPATAKGKKPKAATTDCCICLFSVTICQSLFIAPCSHVFHYKCIRPLLAQHHPGFSCPVCRSFADLEADVETEEAFDIASRRESLLSRRGSLKSVKAAFDQGLANALGVQEPEEVVAAEPEAVWDGGATPGVGLVVDFGVSSAAVPPVVNEGAPPPAEVGALSNAHTSDASEQGNGVDLTPAETIRLAAQAQEYLSSASSSSAAPPEPSSSSFTEAGAPTSAAAAPKRDASLAVAPALPELPTSSPLVVESTLAPPARAASPASSGGEHTSSTSPEAAKDAQLGRGDAAAEGQGSSAAGVPSSS